MNIFYLDPDPVRCARMHCDKHLVKMLTEYAQLLSSAIWVYEPKKALKLYHKKLIMNAPIEVTGRKVNAHFNHRCMVWTRSSRANFDWLKAVAVELGKEFFHRYGWRHGRQHSSYVNCVRHLHSTSKFPNLPFTPPPLAMPDEYKQENAVEAYRNLYRYSKIEFVSYTRRKPPRWLTAAYLKRWYYNSELPLYVPPPLSAEVGNLLNVKLD